MTFLPIDLLKKSKQTISLEPVDEVTIVQLEEGKKVRMGSIIEGKNRDKVLKTLKSRISTFAWKIKDITGVDPIIITHKLSVDPFAKMVK